MISQRLFLYEYFREIQFSGSFVIGMVVGVKLVCKPAL